MFVGSYIQLLFLVLLIICYTSEGYVDRYRRQVIDNTNRNVGIPQQKPPSGQIPINNVPFNPSNNPNMFIPNAQNIPNQQLPNNNPLYGPPAQGQMNQARSPGFYNGPQFQPSLFPAEKPQGWFGTNQMTWMTNQASELDKNKLAAAKTTVPNNTQINVNQLQPRKEDSGPFLLQKIARQYASKGDKAFNYGPYEARQGPGMVCENYDNFDGFTYGLFPCPLPPSTGMNQLYQYCCGFKNYQYCCSAQEFSEMQRGGFVDHGYVAQQPYPKRANYSPSTKKILAIISPIAAFIVIAGIIAVVFLYYKRFRTEQYRTRIPSGAVRLEDDYSILPQHLPSEKRISLQDA